MRGYRPVIVVGVGRTGTSTVCRLIHEKLGIRMFMTSFLRPDQWNPDGYYEDRLVKQTLKDVKRGAKTVGEAARRIHYEFEQGTVPWGFKLQPLGKMPPGLLEAFEPRAVISCVRNRNVTMKSINGWRNWNHGMDRAAETYDRRSVAVKRILHGWSVLVLDFTDKRDDDELTESIAAWIKTCDFLKDNRELQQPALR